MIARNTLCFLLAFYVSFATAQPNIQAGINVATFKMADLKGLNGEFETVFGVQGKQVTSFPPYFGIDVNFGHQIKQHHLAITWSRNTTGSRVAYSDYSGSYSVDQLLTARLFGGSYGRSFILEETKWEIIPSLRLGVINTKLQLKSQVRVANNLGSQNETFVSRSFYTSPGLEVRRNLSTYFFIAADVRYLIEVPVNLVWTEDHDVFLLNRQGTPVAAQWSGLRLIFSIGIKLG